LKLPASFPSGNRVPRSKAGTKIVGISYARFATCKSRFLSLLRKSTNLMIFLDAALRRQTLHFLAFMIQIASDDRQNSFQANHL